MSKPLAPYLSSFAMNAWLFGAAVRVIPEPDADRRLHDRTNTARGIAVHLAGARHSLCKLLGAEIDPLPWSDVGEGFETGFKAGGEKPRLATVLEAWARIEERFAESLLAASGAVLDRASPLPIPGIAEPTVADFVALNVVHESYHVGQLGMIAKALTGKGIMGPVDGEKGA